MSTTITIRATSARRRDPATGNVTGHGRYLVSFRGEVIGTFRTPVCEAARYLLEHGLAAREDKLVMCREGGVPALRGSVGWFADRTVEENDKVSPRWVKHRSLDHRFPLVGVNGDSLLEAAAT